MENSPKTTSAVIVSKDYFPAIGRVFWHFFIVLQVIKDQNIVGMSLLGQLS